MNMSRIYPYYMNSQLQFGKNSYFLLQRMPKIIQFLIITFMSQKMHPALEKPHKFLSHYLCVDVRFEKRGKIMKRFLYKLFSILKSKMYLNPIAFVFEK